MRATTGRGPSRTFASLSIPNYRAYFIGNLVSNTGSWMARTAQSWLVLVTLTNGNAQALGWLTGLMFAPALLLAPTAGWLADRVGKRAIMYNTQAVMGINSLALGLLVISGQVRLWHVLVIATIDGTASALDMPARQAFVSELVPLEGLSNAIGLNSTSFNAARLLGPGLAGALIAWLGTGPVFIVNGLSFAVFMVSLWMLDLDQADLAPTSRGRGRIVEGLRYVRSRPDLLLLMAIAFMMGTFGFNFGITNALMATEAFGKGPGEYGLLGSAMGVGALAAALLSARRQRPRLRHVVSALGVFTLTSLAATFAPTFTWFALWQILIGLAAITIMVTANSLVQLTIDAGVRGRVMALWGAMTMGGTPLVSPLIGWIGDVFGPRPTVAVGVVAIGVTTVVAALWLLRRPVAVPTNSPHA